jgi:hypothetical protein
MGAVGCRAIGDAVGTGSTGAGVGGGAGGAGGPNDITSIPLICG